MEIWQTIDEFPDYMVSNTGQIYSIRAGRNLVLSKTVQGDLKVQLYYDKVGYTRSVRVLVATAFVEPPVSRPVCDTVIVLDNNKNDVSMENLGWRPAWFAVKYALQFQSVYPEHYMARQVQNKVSGRVYSSVLECGITEGLLFKEVYLSCLMGKRVFPSSAEYSFL